MKKLFGTDGMRGEAGVFPLDRETVEIAGKSVARQFYEKLGRTPRFISGRDTRESGVWIEEAFHIGAKSENAECVSAGVITTPGIAFLTKEFRFDAGIVVSASHNPFEDNGIKIFSATGKKIDSETEREIENDIFNKVHGKRKKAKTEAVNNSKVVEFQNAYLNYLADGFKNLRLENFRIVLDCANGAACELAPKLFEKFGAEVVAINNRPNGRNINENCGSLYLENLQKKVLEEKADFGAAFDGDADRALFVDEKGNLVDGDAALWIMARFLQEHGQLEGGKVVATVMSNIGLEIALKSRNIELIRTAVGDKYVLEELLKTGASIGGEQSGHIIFPKKSLVGDGMMTTLFLLEAMYEKQKTLSQMLEGFRRYPQILVNVKVREKIPFETVAEISEAAAKLGNVLDGNGRLLLRYSGTENLARVMIEGRDQAEIENQANYLADVIKTNLG